MKTVYLRWLRQGSLYNGETQLGIKEGGGVKYKSFFMLYMLLYISSVFRARGTIRELFDI